MKRTGVTSGVLLALLFGAATAPGAELVTRPHANGATITWGGGELALVPASDSVAGLRAPEAGVRLEVPGLRTLAEPGSPALAGRAVLVAVPPGARVKLTWSAGGMREQGNVWVAPPESTPVRDDLEGDAPVEFRAVPDPALYATDAFWPAEPAMILSRGVVRDTDYALVQVVPFQWNPVRRVLRIYDELEVRLDYESGRTGKARDSGGATASPGLERERVGKGGRSRENSPAGFANGPAPDSWQLRREAWDLGRVLSGLNPAATGEAWKIEIDRDGLYRVSHAELAAAGFPASEDVARLKLELRGKSVPIHHADPNGNGRFDGGDSLVFYGLANPERFSTVHVYWLTRSGGGSFMTVEEALPPDSLGWPALPSWPAINRLEKNERYQDASPVHPEDGDPWVFNETVRTNMTGCATCLTPPCYFEEPLSIPALAPVESGRSYSIRGRMFATRYQGACFFDTQSVAVTVNGRRVGTVTWKVTDAPWSQWSLPIDPAWLNAPPASNTVNLDTDTVLAPGPHKIWIDYLELDSPARFAASGDVLEAQGSWPGGGVIHAAGFTGSDIEVMDLRGDGSAARLVGYKLLSLGPGMPTTLVFAVPPASGAAAGHRLVAYRSGRLRTARAVYRDAPSNLTAADIGAAHLVIAHPSFLGNAQTLSDYRTTTGIKSQVFDLAQIFDEFSWGHHDPQGLRDFIAYAFSRWSVAPLYVLLVGDASFDYKNFYGLTTTGYPPTSLVPYREFMSHLPLNLEQIFGSDFFYQEMTGDDLPDLLLGRLAVRTPAEVDTYRVKLSNYESQTGSDTWNGRYVLISDDDIGDDVSCPLPPALPPQPAVTEVEVFMRDIASRYLAPAGPDAVQIEQRDYFASPPQGRQAIIDERNRGASTVIYFGHGSLYTLGRVVCASDFFFEDTDLPALTNSTALPLTAAVSCNVGAFHWASSSGAGVRCSGETFTVTSSRGDIAFLASTTLISFPGGKGEVEGMVDGLFTAGSSYLPPFLGASDAARRAGGIHYAAQMGFFTNPRVTLPYQTDNQRTLVLHGDPAAKLKIQNP